MNNKKQTSVDFLVEKLKLKIGNSISSVMQEEIDQAKEMEKEQIAEAYYIGDKNGCGCYDYCTKEDSEQYYNETYEK
jgi:3-hydroxyacyl-CoA dehydrogenase